MIEVGINRRNMKKREKLEATRVKFAVMRKVCNAWYTTRRFQQDVSPCWFCGLDAGDDIEHYLDCGVVHAFVDSHIGLHWWPGRRSAALRKAIVAVALSVPKLVVTSALVDSALQTHNSARSNRQCASAYQLMVGRWRALLRTSPSIEHAWRSITSLPLVAGRDGD